MTMHQLLALGLLFTVSLISCAPSSQQKTLPTATQQATDHLPESFKVVSWNVWHGLKAGKVTVKPSESPEQNAARLEFQVQQIAREQPDLVLLQEVNPLPQRAEQYVKALGELGLDYTEIHQVDACGIRLSQKRALVSGLNNGLAILAKTGLDLQKIKGLKLSGSFGKCESTAGLQLEELRYGLIGEITFPRTNRKYLVTSLHLHSGLEAGEGFFALLSELHKQGRLQRYADFRWEILKPRLRRIEEIDRLMRELYQLKREEPYAGMIIGGDFNFESDFLEHEEITMLQLTDTYQIAHREGDLYTADPVKNSLIEIDTESALPSGLESLARHEESVIQAVITDAYQQEKQRPRRIDYILSHAFLPEYCVRQTLFGTEKNVENFPASDHFGVLNSYVLNHETC